MPHVAGYCTLQYITIGSAHGMHKSVFVETAQWIITYKVYMNEWKILNIMYGNLDVIFFQKLYS